MDWDDVAAKPPAATVGDNLASMSVAGLEARVRALEAEIDRVKGELARKHAFESAAAAIFKS